jgi:methylase of polypeptide subunit release factors
VNKKIKKYVTASPYLDMEIPILDDISLPKSGRLFVNFLKELNFKNKKVLDVGTGYYGYLAQHAKKFGANYVLAVDINTRAIKKARTLNKSGNIHFSVSDVYSKILKRGKFNIVLSNPPQLPSRNNNRIHDFGGYYGLDVIKKIIDGFKFVSTKNGVLCLLVFDYLLTSIKILCKENALSCDIIGHYNKNVRKGGETEKKIKFIEKIYTKYKFKKNNGSYAHKVYILKIKKYENNNKSSCCNLK